MIKIVANSIDEYDNFQQSDLDLLKCHLAYLLKN